ncbi:hypothetical protein PDQ40_23440 [Bacillus cereus group sp. Bc061]|uniref:hypothetical protein n=1 Tax=Bacillus cereus group sp. Bc061 TaxID=3018117 RepID=UPI0022E1027C|nr:hypothetical protein [Bacillus cereus group sp. Bc061]MDA2598604.1 hypothetical protein [Bacillus cereus group sp. Bc061]
MIWLFGIVLVMLMFSSSYALYYYRKEKLKGIDRTNIPIAAAKEAVIEEKDVQIYKENPIPWQFIKVDNEYQGKEIPLNEELKDSIVSMMNMSKTEVFRNMGRGKEIYELVFTDEIKMEFKKGTIHLMDSVKNAGFKRGMAVDGAGKIVAQAELKKIKFKPGQLKNLAIGVATVIVSQEHLQEIKQELSVLNKKIDEVIGMMKNEYVGRAKGTYRYIKDNIYPLYNSYSWTESNKIELERRYHQTIDDIEILLGNLKSMKDGIGDINQRVWISYKEEYEKIESISRDFKNFEEVIEVNLQNAILLFKYRQLHDLDAAIEKSTKESLEELYGVFIETHNDFQKEIKKFIVDFKIKFFTSKNENEIKNRLTKELSREYKKRSENLNSLNSISNLPASIKIEILNGEIVGLKK